MKKSKVYNYLVKSVLILGIFIGIGYFALVLVYMIPVEGIKENLYKSYSLLESEGTWRKLVKWHDDTMLDNWTDSTILIESGYEYTQPVYQAALLVPQCSVGSDNPTDSFIKIYRQDDDLEIHEWNYVNYWHGYLIFIKPLLLFLTYGQIRYLNQFVQTLLISAIFVLLGYKKKILYAIPFALTYIFLNPAVVSMSIQYNTMFLITFLQVLFILIQKDRYNSTEFWLFHFLIVGCITSYFDFLTYPIIGYGIPFVLLVSLYPLKIKEELCSFIKTGVMWCVGYVGMWAGKWIIGTMLTHENIILKAIERIKYRSRGEAETYTYLEVLQRNFRLRRDVIIVSILFMGFCFMYVVIKKEKIKWNETIIYLLIALIPFAWYLMAANHSYEHAFFTYRSLGVFVISIAFIGVKQIEIRRKV